LMIVLPAANSSEVMLSKMACLVAFSMCSNNRLFCMALSACQQECEEGVRRGWGGCEEGVRRV